MRTEGKTLSQRRVLVTRPAHQSANLCELIEQAGGIPLRLPVLAIIPPADPQRAQAQLRQLSGFDMGIFISRNAVDKSIELLHPDSLPPGVKWLAIGQATASALEERGYIVTLKPDGDSTSEDLLVLPGLQKVAGKRIAILRGEGGRELLAEVLRKRGAIVEYIETYRAVCPVEMTGELRDLLAKTPPDPAVTGQQKVKAQGIDLVIATSTLIQQNLLEMSGNYRNRLLQRPLVVLSARARHAALTAGFTRVYIAPRSDDAGIVEALIQAASQDV